MTSSFIGEVLIIISLFKINKFVLFLGASSVILSACYALWLYQRVIFGIFDYNYIKLVCDLSKREFHILFP